VTGWFKLVCVRDRGSAREDRVLSSVAAGEHQRALLSVAYESHDIVPLHKYSVSYDNFQYLSTAHEKLRALL
jgi:hypothetical protein